MRLLLIDDNRDFVFSLKRGLSKEFVVDVAYDGKQGTYFAESNEYDIIILDIMLPDMDGIEICKNLRKANIQTPIIMLTGQYELSNKIYALDEGADDYVTKPFHVGELLSRIRAILRRQSKILSSNILTIGDLRIDINKKQVIRDNKVIPLRKKEFYLLEYLARNAGNVITREMILDHVWEAENDSLTNIVDVHIKYLRDQIDKDFSRKLIKTVHGLGYKLEI